MIKIKKIDDWKRHIDESYLPTLDMSDDAIKTYLARREKLRKTIIKKYGNSRLIDEISPIEISLPVEALVDNDLLVEICEYIRSTKLYEVHYKLKPIIFRPYNLYDDENKIQTVKTMFNNNEQLLSKYDGNVRINPGDFNFEQAFKAYDNIENIIEKINKSTNENGEPLSQYEKFMAAFCFATSFEYNETPNRNERFKARQIESIGGDFFVCIGYARLLQFLCDRLDIYCGIENLVNHASNAIILDDKKYGISGLYHSDACWSCIGEKGKISSRYARLPDVCWSVVSHIKTIKDVGYEGYDKRWEEYINIFGDLAKQIKTDPYKLYQEALEEKEEVPLESAKKALRVLEDCGILDEIFPKQKQVINASRKNDKPIEYCLSSLIIANTIMVSGDTDVTKKIGMNEIE